MRGFACRAFILMGSVVLVAPVWGAGPKPSTLTPHWERVRLQVKDRQDEVRL